MVFDRTDQMNPSLYVNYALVSDVAGSVYDTYLRVDGKIALLATMLETPSSTQYHMYYGYITDY